MLDFLKELDTALLLFLNGLGAPWLDTPMFMISQKFFWLPLYLLLLALIVIRYRMRALIVMLFVLVLITLSDQITDHLKPLIMRPRPGHNPDITDLLHYVNGKKGSMFGFVSAHAANSTALAVFMLLLLKDRFKWVVPVMVSYAILVSYSRIYLGVHYPGDVIGGMILGTFLAFLMRWVWQKVYVRISPVSKNIH